MNCALMEIAQLKIQILTNCFPDSMAEHETSRCEDNKRPVSRLNTPHHVSTSGHARIVDWRLNQWIASVPHFLTSGSSFRMATEACSTICHHENKQFRLAMFFGGKMFCAAIIRQLNKRPSPRYPRKAFFFLCQLDTHRNFHRNPSDGN